MTQESLTDILNFIKDKDVDSVAELIEENQPINLNTIREDLIPVILLSSDIYILKYFKNKKLNFSVKSENFLYNYYQEVNPEISFLQEFLNLINISNFKIRLMDKLLKFKDLDFIKELLIRDYDYTQNKYMVLNQLIRFNLDSNLKNVDNSHLEEIKKIQFLIDFILKKMDLDRIIFFRDNILDQSLKNDYLMDLINREYNKKHLFKEI